MNFKFRLRCQAQRILWCTHKYSRHPKEIQNRNHFWSISGTGHSGCMLQRTGGARRFSGWEAHRPEGVRGDGPRVGGIASCMPADCTMHQMACASVCHSLLPVPAGRRPQWGWAHFIELDTENTEMLQGASRRMVFKWQESGAATWWFLCISCSFCFPSKPANKLRRVPLILHQVTQIHTIT